MKPKQILFNTDMVRAILENRKSETRRVVKPQPNMFNLRDGIRIPYQAGDILYVRETFRIDYLANIPGTGRVQYKADGTYADFSFSPDRYDMMRRAQLKPGWRPSENMPREAARIFLRVTDVRVERLQDITVDGVLREGIADIEPPPICQKEPHYPESFPKGFDKWNREKQDDWIQSEARARYIGWLDYANNLIRAFRAVWDTTIKKADIARYGWDANPWVFVNEFERISRDEALQQMSRVEARI